MRIWHVTGAMLVAVMLAGAQEPAPPGVESIEIRERFFLLNGKPFFPIMAWLQDAKNLPAVRACGMNATAGYWRGSGKTEGVREYLDQVQQAGLYGVMPFDPVLKGHKALLGYIQGDEPDLPRQVSDAKVEAAPGMRINSKTPLWKLLDGDVSSWSVLDPLDKATLTITLPQAVTVKSLAVHATVSSGLAVAKDVVFHGDGAEILKATLEAKRSQQKFDLAKPATFKELKLTVLSVTPGKQEWGSIGEIEGLDVDGENVLLSRPRTVPRHTPEEVLAAYRQAKSGDPSRPVFMTFTANFHPHFKKFPDDQRVKLYTDFLPGCDVIGYDVYPIYGWNKPEWIHLVHDCTQTLAEMAGPRPVYAWIETSKGGQWTGDLAKQKDVTPEHIRAEVWMAICRGATAIGYFTHVWKPAYSQFGVPDENRKALKSINDQITRLAPAILGQAPKQKVRIEAEGGVKLDIMVKQSGGELHLFAVNYDEKLKQSKAKIHVEGLAAGTSVVVIDEDRTIRAEDGAFADTFAPLAVHLYRVGSKP